LAQVQQEPSLAQVQQEPSLAQVQQETSIVEVRQESSLVEESTHVTAETYVPIVTPKINNFVDQDNIGKDKNILDQDNEMTQKNSTSKNPSLVADTQPKTLLQQDIKSTVDVYVVETPLATKSADPLLPKFFKNTINPRSIPQQLKLMIHQ